MEKNLQTVLIIATVFVTAYVVILYSSSMVTAQLNVLQTQQGMHAMLFGNKEVPSITTSATGLAQFRLSLDKKTLTYDLIINNIHNITKAYIYQGKVGENGPPIVPLSVGTGIIKSANLQGPLSGKQVSDLVNLIKSGQAYVNISTKQNKNGEIRGQILRLQN